MPDTVAIVGSINIDHTITVEHFPRPGQTLLGTSVTTSVGGKGANQAVAAAKAGAKAIMIGAVGDDGAGGDAILRLRQSGVDTRLISHTDIASTGTAWITVSSGENTIIVAAGANHTLNHIDLPTDVDVVLCQLEVPLAVVEEASARTEAIFMLNAAPSCALPDALLARCDVLIVNEHELADVAGVAAPDPGDTQAVVAASRHILARGAKAVVVTLGPLGALLCTGDGHTAVAAPPVIEVVDTTGAGDAFCGVFAARVAAGDAMPEALRWGVAAGTLSVRKPTAQASYPDIAELISTLQLIPTPSVLSWRFVEK